MSLVRKVAMPLLALLLVLTVVSSAGAAVHAVQTHSKKIAITFDDGPSPTWDPPILSTLKRYGAHATFFEVGRRIVENPQQAIDVAAAYNEIGNHSYTHAHMTSLGHEGMAAEMDQTTGSIHDLVLGRNPTLFRAPYGDGTDSPQVNQLADERGMKVAGWSFSFDHLLNQYHRNRRNTLKALLSKVRPGSIILAHDGGLNGSATLWLLPRLLARLRDRGYEVTTVSDLLHSAGGRIATATSHPRENQLRGE